MTGKNQWSYKIDYAKAMADDVATIAMYADGGPVDRLSRAYAPLASRYPDTLPDNAVFAVFVAADGSLAEFDAFLAAAGIDRPTALAHVLAGWGDAVPSDEVSAAAEAAWPRGSGSYRAAETSTLGLVPYETDTNRRRILAKARASLARHRRNAEKNR